MILFVTPASEPALPPLTTFDRALSSRFSVTSCGLYRRGLDLYAYCIRRPSATYFVWDIGDSMKDIGLHSGDLMAVYKAEKTMQRDIVIAETDGEFTVKRQQLKPRIALLPINPAYPTLYPDQLQIFGVVMAFIHKTRDTN